MKKLFLLSFEGLNYDLLNQWIAAGHLKNFEKLKNEGYLSKIKCSRVPYESSGIMSVLSGQSDKVHDQYSYWKVRNKDYIPAIHKGEILKEHHFWNQDRFLLSRKAIINIFGTHPAYELNGFLISYAMENTLRYSYPASLMKELYKKGISYTQDMAAFYKKQSKQQFINEVLKVEKLRHAVVKELLLKKLDLYVCNYTCIDRVCHFFMDELLNPNIELTDKAVFIMYKYCDEILGKILSAAEDNAMEVILFSSVGFGHLNKFVEINQFLMQERLFKFVDGSRVPDWSKTIAFESVQGSHGININKKSFYDFGIVKENEYEMVMDEVIYKLKQMKNPYSCEKMFCNVYKGKDFYNNNPEAPDIVLEPFDWTYLPYGDCYWSDKVGRHNQTGWHRNESVWGRYGSSINRKNLEDITELKDIYTEIQYIGK